jgi:P27 family predicted phage terminase small subunit
MAKFVSDAEHALKGTVARPRVNNLINLVVEGGRPTCPRALSKTARKEWRTMLKLLESRGVLDPGTGPNLELWARTKARWIECITDLDTHGLVLKATKTTSRGELYTVETENPMLKIAQDCEATLLQLLKAFGLEPASRERVKKVRTTVGRASEPAWVTKLKAEAKDAGPEE